MTSIDTILKAIDNGSAANVLTEAHDRALFARHHEALKAIETRARKSAAEPIPTLPFSLHRLFEDTGDRKLFEAPYFARRRALADYEVCLLAGLDADGSIAAALGDLLWAICDEYSWALPAHQTLRRPRPIIIDLFAAETGMYLAEALHLVGDQIDKRVADRCRDEIRRRILDSFLGNYPVEWWERGTNNWGAVCACSVGIAFLYEEGDPARRTAALTRVLATMDAFLSSFPPDGTCMEGSGYWEYGFGFFSLFADFVHQYTGGAADLFDDPRARRIALFPQNTALSPTRTVSFADGGRFASSGSPAKIILHRHYGESVRLGSSNLAEPSYKPSLLLRSLLWADPGTIEPPLADRTIFLPDAQWLVVRRAPFAFAALFGNNGAPHNHNDIGSFLLVDGEAEGPMDLGSGEYTRQYFSAERYSILCNGSQGHSVPIIGGNYQKDGMRFAAREVSFAERDGLVLFSADIAGAYDLAGLASLVRAFEVDPEAGRVAIRDSFSFNGPSLPVTERFVGYAEAEIVAPGEVVFGAFRLRFDPALQVRLAHAPMNGHTRRHDGRPLDGGTRKVTLLDIEVPAGTVSFAAAFERR